MTQQLDDIDYSENVNGTRVKIYGNTDPDQIELNFKGDYNDIDILFNVETNNVEVPLYNRDDDVLVIPFDVFEVGIVKFIEYIKSLKEIRK